MKKEEFARSYAEASGITIKAAKEQVNGVLDHITNVVVGLNDGEKLSLTGVVSFTVKDTPARKGRNPQNGEEIDIPAGRKVVASAAGKLKSQVNG